VAAQIRRELPPPERVFVDKRATKAKK